jgi:hypothetical protein
LADLAAEMCHDCTGNCICYGGFDGGYVSWRNNTVTSYLKADFMAAAVAGREGACVAGWSRQDLSGRIGQGRLAWPPILSDPIKFAAKRCMPLKIHELLLLKFANFRHGSTVYSLHSFHSFHSMIPSDFNEPIVVDEPARSHFIEM